MLSLASLLALCLLVSSAFSSSEAPTLRSESGIPLEKRAETGDKYLLGVGKADVTGPVVEINLAGYADLDQSGSGLRQRLYSRAFIVGELGAPANRHIYLVLDTQSGDTAIRYGILEKLASMGPEYAVYGSHNIAVTGTHSHAGPGGWFNYLLPQVTSLGFEKQSYQAIVDGAVLSIKRAHESLAEGYLDFGTTDITNGAINRSLWAYLHNPEEERALYSHEVDTTMTLLRFKRASDGKDVGVLTWYSVHGTSLFQNYTHVAGDNKGVASWLFEKEMANNPSVAPGFVAGFSQASVADTTPNVLGAWCEDGSGQQCSLENSTCADGTSQACHGRGPLFEKDDKGVASCYEIGKRQYDGAKYIYDDLVTNGTPVRGTTVKAFHFFHDMSFYQFSLPSGETAMTCPAALGYSFAAGTTDGPGAFDFTQGDSGEPSANPLWRIVSGIIRTPTDSQKTCQEPKPILLDVGEMEVPYAWSPNIVDVQVMRIGQFFMIASPSEVTTMSGRRWKKAIAEEARSSGLTTEEPHVVIAGPANTYAHYVATPEEYEVQRYEGASTLFGKHTLDAYINLTTSNLAYLSSSATSLPASGPSPPDNRRNSISLTTGVVQDNAPISRSFGQCIAQPAPTYAKGTTSKATFVGANPRNNLRLEGTFAAVEQKMSDGSWKHVRDDGDWTLVYTWRRTDFLLGYSEVDLEWEIETDAASGEYRFRYYGDSKSLFGGVRAFEGVSQSFTVG